MRLVESRRPNRAPSVIALVLALSMTTLAPLVAASEPVRPQSVWTVFTTVEAEIQDNYATVRVIADIGNRGPDPEFPFQVRIPDDAFISGLTITRDGETFEAEIKPRAEARQQYDEHKAREQTGGLVEKSRHSSVYAMLINVAEFESVQAVLTYERYLAATEGITTLELEAPVSGFGQDLGARFDVTVAHADGVVAAWSTGPSHARPVDGVWHLTHAVDARPDDAATPFAVSYTTAATGGPGSIRATVLGDTGYFAHRFTAPPDATDLPLDLVLVLDTSGSMRGVKIDQLKDAATQVLAGLDDEDRVQIVLFSSAGAPALRTMHAADRATRDEAIDAIDRAFAAGGTNIDDGLRLGIDAFLGDDDGRAQVLVLLTDGKPTSGATDRAALEALAADAAALGINVYTIAFGADADWGLVHGLAEAGDGIALRVPEGAGAEVDLRRFMDALTTPVLRDVRIQYDDGVDAMGRHASLLLAGSELLVIGTFDPKLTAITGRVTATGPDGPRSYTFDGPVETGAGLAFLPRLVAHQAITRDQLALDADGHDDALVARIIELAMRFGFVTDHTSLVVTLDPSTRRAMDDREAVAMDGAADGSATPPPGAPNAGRPVSGADASKGAEAIQSRPPATPDGSHSQVPEGGDPSTTPGEPASTPPVPVLAFLAVVGLVVWIGRRRA